MKKKNRSALSITQRKEFIESLQRRVTKLMTEQGLSLRQFARVAHLSPATMVWFFQGRKVHERSLKKILIATNPLHGDTRFVAMNTILSLKKRFYTNAQICDICEHMADLSKGISKKNQTLSNSILRPQ